MKNEKYSNELNRLLTYMEDKLSEEMPTAIFNLDYFILAILDQKDSFIYRRLDENLTEMTLETLFNVYYQLVKQRRLSGIRPHREVKYDSKFQKILELADGEREKLQDEKISSEHVFLAILNDESDENKIRKVFNKAGVEYNLLLDRISTSQNETVEEEIPEETEEVQPPMMPPGTTTMIKIEGVDDPQMINTIMSSIMPGAVEMARPNTGGGKKSKKNIEAYCVNLNKLAAEGKIDRLVGREKEVASIVRVLGRRKKNNVILVGQGGAGKTAIAEGIAYLIEQGSVPPLLYGKKIVSLDMTAIMAGTSLRGMFEERVKGLLDELTSDKSYILLIDGIDSVLGARNGQNDYDISAMLSHSLDNGDIQVIGTSDFKGYRNTFDKDPSLSRKFQKIIVEAPTRDECYNILNSTKEYYENYHNVKYTKEAIDACVELAEKYITERNLPDSAIDILDEVGSSKSLNNMVDERINDLRHELTELRKSIIAFKNEDKYEQADNLSDKERELTLKLIDANKTFEEKKKTAEPREITKEDIMEIVSDKTKIPLSKLSADDKKRIATIDQRIKKEVIGQDYAIDNVCRAIKRNRVGLRNGRTYGSFLFIGKTGVGKTLLAKKLAKEVFGDEDALVRFDMSEYADKTSVNKLIGSSAGYVGYEDGGVMTEEIKNKKHCVILLDEIEKADPEVYNIFLQVFDEGFLTDNTGQKVDFKNTIIILTSNVGTKAAAEFGKGIGFGDGKEDDKNNKKILLKELKKKFPPEFLNRLDDIIYFNNLTDDNLNDVIKLEMEKMVKRAKGIGFDVTYDEGSINYILDIVKEDKEFGARPIIRAIEDAFEDKITDLILENDYENHTFEITVTPEKGLEIK